MAALTILTLILGRRIFRPLDRLRSATNAVGAGDLTTRLGWHRRDELGQLASDFDAMAAHLEEHRRGLVDLVHRDPLTELPNHRRFQEALAEEYDRARGEGRPFAVVLLDIDEFKRINEARGHPYGDELLGAAASGLGAAMRDLGVVARVGGDEFGVVLPDTDASRAFALAEAARAAIEQAAPVSGTLRCSAGVAAYPERCEERRRPAPARRGRAGLGQGERPWARAPLRPRARLRRHGRAARGLRRPDRAPPGRAPRVPADRGHGERRAGRLRGARALRRQARTPAVVVVLAGPPVRPRSRARGGVGPRRAGRAEPPRGDVPVDQPEPLGTRVGRGRASSSRPTCVGW